MTVSTGIALALGTIYLLFLLWYGGRGKPLTQREIEAFFAELTRRASSPPDPTMLAQLRDLLVADDGREFVMQNLVRYRTRARYPAGHAHATDTDPRAADRRYGRAIVWPLLRHGNLMLFVARRGGRFIEPEGGAPDWHYVAMVRYRSRRDFMRFALAIERADIVVHKWAAIATTHVFPVQPLLSLVFVRSTVAALLALAGLLLHGLVT
jgi:hypothetical protein